MTTGATGFELGFPKVLWHALGLGGGLGQRGTEQHGQRRGGKASFDDGLFHLFSPEGGMAENQEAVAEFQPQVMVAAALGTALDAGQGGAERTRSPEGFPGAPHRGRWPS